MAIPESMFRYYGPNQLSSDDFLEIDKDDVRDLYVLPYEYFNYRICRNTENIEANDDSNYFDNYKNLSHNNNSDNYILQDALDYSKPSGDDKESKDETLMNPRFKNGKVFPFRWMAPETFLKQLYSFKSEIWLVPKIRRIRNILKIYCKFTYILSK